MSTGRLEAFSDGVFAVAITLLSLGLVVVAPHALHGTTLRHHLLQEWPSYAAYVVSFITIGIIWINHHVMIGRLRAADHPILILNLVLLMTVVALPFTTNLMATYLPTPDAKTAAVVYSGSFLVMGLAFISLNRHILLKKTHLLAQEMQEVERRRIYRRAMAGSVPYALAVVLALFSPYASLVICGLIAAYYAVPFASSPDR